MNDGKKLKLKILLVFCITFQLLVPIIIKKNENKIVDKGQIYRFNVDTIVNDYENSILYVDIETRKRSQIARNNQVYTGYSTFASENVYQIFTNIHDRSYLNPVLRAFIDKDNNYLQDTRLIYKVKNLPTQYINGDILHNLHYNDITKLGYLKLEVDVIVKESAYIVQEIYVNGYTYNQFVEKYYFDMLEGTSKS